MDLGREEFESIRDLIRERCGIMLRDKKMSYLRPRLEARLRETGMHSCRDYYYFLKYDPAGAEELDRLIDAVAVNETYFFRERETLEDLVDGLASTLGTTPGQFTVWSAGCSTGDEAYTLAMLLAEAGLGAGRVTVLASDISRPALNAAREGIYEEHNLRYVPDRFRQAYFRRTEDGGFAVREPIRQAVRFARVNLLDPAEVARLPLMTCAVCRNLIIYFEDRERAACVDNIYRVLDPGGLLLLGIGENLGRVSTLFEVVRLPHGSAYRKPKRGGT